MKPIMKATTGIVIALWAAASPAHAQYAVFDSASFAQLVEQFKNGVEQLGVLEQQLQQAQQMYAAANQLTNVNSLGAALSNPLVRQFLPGDASQMGNMVQSGLSGDYSSLSGSAQALAQANRLFTPSTTTDSGDAAAQTAMTTQENIIASAAAAGQQIYATATTRLEGLEELRDQIGSDPDAKQIQDLQARLQAEQAEIQNDQMRLQGLKMVQDAAIETTQEQGKERAYTEHESLENDYKSAAGD